MKSPFILSLTIGLFAVSCDKNRKNTKKEEPITPTVQPAFSDTDVRTEFFKLVDISQFVLFRSTAFSPFAQVGEPSIIQLQEDIKEKIRSFINFNYSYSNKIATSQPLMSSFWNEGSLSLYKKDENNQSFHYFQCVSGPIERSEFNGVFSKEFIRSEINGCSAFGDGAKMMFEMGYQELSDEQFTHTLYSGSPNKNSPCEYTFNKGTWLPTTPCTGIMNTFVKGNILFSGSLLTEGLSSDGNGLVEIRIVDYLGKLEVKEGDIHPHDYNPFATGKVE